MYNIDALRGKIFFIILPVICGLTSANMYYIQPLIPFIQKGLFISYKEASMLYSYSLIGNAISLLFIIPAGDSHSKKKIIESLFIISIISLLFFYITPHYYMLSILAVCIGIGTSAIPLIIASMSRQNDGAGVNNIGIIMAGVLIGILSSRFISSLFGSILGWKSIYLFSSLVMLLSYIYLRLEFPKEDVVFNKASYKEIIRLNIKSFFENSKIRYYSANGFIIMCIFASYWSNVSSYLLNNFNLTQFEIGVFSLTGVAGATSALLSTKLLKEINYNNKILYISCFISFALMLFFKNFLIISIIGALLIDAFIQLTHINNQRQLFLVCKGIEARAASCYMTSFVFGGAFGGILSSYIYSSYKWEGVVIFCMIMSLTPFLLKHREFNNE